MKKIYLFLIVSIFIALSGCANENDLAGLTEYQVPDFSEENEWDFPENDPEIKIDGVMDEEIWDQVSGNELVFESKVSEDIKMSTVAYLGELGVYFGIVVKDSAVYYNSDRRASKNSGAEIYVNEFGKYINDNYTFSFRLVPTGIDGEIATETYIYDQNGEATSWIASYKAASTVQGLINTSLCEGYSIELFIPYKTLNINEPCDYIQYFPAFNRVESDSSESERTWTGYPGCKTQFPYSWIIVSNEKIENRFEIPVKRTIDSYMQIDGVLDEAEWVNTYRYQIIENNVTVTTEMKTHFGQKGIYLGFIVDEKKPQIISTEKDNNHGAGIVFFLTNGRFSIRTSWQIRVFADGYYRVGRYSGVSANKWYTPDATTHLNLETKSVMTNDNYSLEIFLPYQEIGLNEKPENITILPGTFGRKADGEYAERYGHLLTGDGTMDLNNYLVLSEEKVATKNIYMDEIILVDDANEEGYYEKTFSAFLDNKSLNPLLGLKFSENINAYIKDNQDGSYTLSIPKELVKEQILICKAMIGKIEKEFFIQQKSENKGIIVDGLLDDEQWVRNGYSYYATEADNTVEVETISYLHQEGIYLGFIVNDSNAKIISSSPNENHGSGISFFISDGPLNTKTSHMLRIFMDGYYRCARYEGTRWYGVQNDYFLDIEVATTITEEGYIIEAYFPFSSLGMENGTEDIYVFSGAFIKKADGTYAERYGLVNTYSSKIGDVVNYFHFDENGYKKENLKN